MNARILISVILLTFASGCGWIQAGNTSAGIEARPDGDVVAQGNLSSIKTGYTVTGSVSIYRLTGTNTLVLRVEGLSVSPSENTFQLTGIASGGTDFVTNLRFVSGNANYTTNITYPATITRVILESLSLPPPREIAAAGLTAP